MNDSCIHSISSLLIDEYFAWVGVGVFFSEPLSSDSPAEQAKKHKVGPPFGPSTNRPNQQMGRIGLTAE